MPITEMARETGRLWAALDEKEKEPYILLSNKDGERYKNEMNQLESKGFFITKIFHPNVAKNGSICVNTLKKDWKPEYGLEYVLSVIKCLLIHPNPASALNEEAGKLLLEQYDDFAEHAKMMTQIHAKPTPAEAAVAAATEAAGSEHRIDVDGERHRRCAATTVAGLAIFALPAESAASVGAALEAGAVGDADALAFVTLEAIGALSAAASAAVVATGHTAAVRDAETLSVEATEPVVAGPA